MPDQNELELLDPLDSRWSDLALADPCSNIFHHPAWINTLAECYGYRPFVCALLDRQGSICAGIPMMQSESPLTGKRWVALPFTDHCQPLYRDSDSIVKLTQALACYAQSDPACHIEIRWDLPAQPLVHTFSPYVQHTLPLETNIDQVARRLHRTQRQNIGTAQKRGVEIRWAQSPEDLHVFYSLQCRTRRRQGVPVQPRKFFDLIFKNIICIGLGFILLAYLHDQCIAGGVFLHWQKTLSYKYSASSDEGHELRPNHLLSWTAIRWACENGFTAFDFGRTDLEDEGLRTFKNRWGAVERPLFYSTFNADRTGKRLTSSGRLKHVMQFVLQHSPVWVCRMTGELLYTHFG